MRIQSAISPLTGVLLGASYGLAARWLIRDPGPHGHAVTYTFTGVSIAFLFLVPFALGMLTAALVPRDTRLPWLYWLFTPWISVGLMLMAAAVLALEGAICIVMASPVLMAMGMLGGAAVGLTVTIRRQRAAPRPMVVAALVLPFLFGPAEARMPPADDVRTVTTIVDIDAPPDVVWRHVVRVPWIGEGEQRTGLFQKIGIPRPLEATLDGEGVGALREARFAGGIRFHERITEWEPQHRLGFTITADADSIPVDVLDAHVRVGGEHFDVDFGRFTLEPHGRGTRLRLESRHHVRTHLNFYAHLWTDAVMRDIQSNICRVIRRRAEGYLRPANS
jgi:uncharacterized protein YndB with AHSA1/START domain